MAQAVSCHPFVVPVWFRSQASSSGTYGRQSGNGTGFSLSTLVFPVCTIPPMVHIHVLFISCWWYTALAVDSIIKHFYLYTALHSTRQWL